jgi:CheY-like chemotaxis protein
VLTAADGGAEAENGEQALAAVAKQRPDLILMDIQLPIMDAYEATRRIKADPTLRSTPIIAVTSYVEEQKAQAAGWRRRTLAGRWRGCGDFERAALLRSWRV